MEDYKNKKLTYEDLKNIPIENLGMSSRTTNTLRRFGVDNVAKLIVLSDDQLKRFRNMGDKSLKEIYDTIDSFGNEEITSNMNEGDALVIGMNDKAKEKYIKEHLDIVLELKPNEIGISSYTTNVLKEKEINNVSDLVLSTEARLKKIVSSEDIHDIKNALRKFNLHLGMIKSEMDELISTSKEPNIEDGLYDIVAINELLRKRNKEQEVENDFSKAQLEVLKLLHINYSDIEELSDEELEKIFETIDLIKEGKDLKEAGDKINEEIDDYVKKLNKSSHVIEQKVKVKRKKDEDH